MKSFIYACILLLIAVFGANAPVVQPAGQPPAAPPTLPGTSIPSAPQAAPTAPAQPSVQLPSIPTDITNAKPYIDDKLVVIGSGAINGVYFPAGGAICRLVNRDRKTLGLKCAVETTPGSIYNLTSLKNAELDLAIVQSDWQENAFNGTSDFSKLGRIDNLRFLFSLHDEAFTVIVPKKSSITKFEDIKGKIINVGPEGSGVRSTMAEVMKAKNWTSADFKSLSEFKTTEQAKALCDGRIDVMLLISGHPNGAVQEVVEMCDVKVIEVNDPEIQKLVESNPEYSETVILGGLYPGIPIDTKTFALKATVVATTDLSDSIAYNITRLVFDNLTVFKSFHPVFANLTTDKMAVEGRTAPYHNGALKYYNEKGIIKIKPAS